MQLSTCKHPTSKLTIPNPRYMSLAGSEIAIIRNPVLSTEKSRNFQSKTLTLKNKNKIFQKFLSPLLKTTYEHQVHS